MIKNIELHNYCKKMFLDFELSPNILFVNEKEYFIVDNETTLFDEDFNFLPKTDIIVDGFVYQLCGRWYLQEKGKEVSMKPLLYEGVPKIKIKNNSFLGIHSGNELLNGVGLYEDWIKKAKFLDIQALGICEKNNIGGSMDFQNKCLKNDIKPIFGMSIDIESKTKTYSIKCYAKDFQGWQNLLKFSYLLNVENEVNIKEEYLIENKDGLCIIIDPKGSKYSEYDFADYYQLDTVIFEEEGKDIDYINSLEAFINSDMKPILLNDAYCIEKDDWMVREKLWGIAKSFDYRSKNQYFKNNDEIAVELINMFESGNNSWLKLFKESKNNLEKLVSQCNFTIDTSSRHLPKYVMTKEESEKYGSNKEMFMTLIKNGFKERGISKDKQKQYLERVVREIDVLKKGDVIDYFLFTRDILNFAKSRNILVGIGRGSAGGSLVSYLLGIIQIDPLEFDLIFERFLNEGRMGKLTECEAYSIETECGKTITLNEKSIVKIKRNNKIINVFIEDVLESDEIIKY